MNTKEIKINIPEGYEIDKENSTFECIKFKPIKSKFSDYDGSYRIEGWHIADDKTSFLKPQKNNKYTKDTFATEKQAKSALAMAQISQIMANDKRFGGVITDEEWLDGKLLKYALVRTHDTSASLELDIIATWYFLAFHTREQLNLFYKENKQLVNDYLMLEAKEVEDELKDNNN